MPSRRDPLITGYYYHIYVRSIAGFVVFNNSYEYRAIIEIIDLCKYVDFQMKYSKYKMLTDNSQKRYLKEMKESSKKLVDIVSYCLMPTHIHLLLKQEIEGGISKFMNRVLNSYSKRFNKAHKRNGPLWASRFKSVLVSSDEQLLHLTRYIHLNPSSAGLIKKPEEWKYSSYSGFISKQQSIINPKIIDMIPKEYRRFVEDRKEYQKQLSKIKSVLIDHYSG